MNIAMIQDAWWPQVGGGPMHVKDLSVSMAEELGHNVDIYTRKLAKDGDQYRDDETLCDGKVTVHRQGPTTEFHNPLGRVASLFSLVPFGELSGYDVVHGHTYLPAVPAKLTSVISGTPVVYTVHGTAINSGVGLAQSKLRNRIERKVEKLLILNMNYDHVISVNREHLDLLEQAHDSVSCIPNGIDVDRFDVEERTVSGRILYVGRLAREKRVSDLIKALPHVLENQPEASLVVVGTGPERSELEELARNLDVEESVEFTGRVSDEEIPKYYNSAELYVLPSIWEGHPLTLLEAWASGTPVIASDTEGISEFVDHDTNGWLFEPKSVSNLASRIVDVLSKEGERSRISKNAKETVKSEFTWSKASHRTHEIYKNVV